VARVGEEPRGDHGRGAARFRQQRPFQDAEGAAGGRQGRGTRRRYPIRIREGLASKFLHDPNFTIVVNGVSLPLTELPGFEDTKSLPSRHPKAATSRSTSTRSKEKPADGRTRVASPSGSAVASSVSLDGASGGFRFSTGVRALEDDSRLS
jgi:hypothetical protein